LPTLTNNLDLDINLSKRLRKRVDLDKTRVDGTRKATELGDKTNVTLVDRLVGVRAAEAAGNGAESSNGRTESVDHTAIPAGARRILGVGLDDLGVRRLEVLAAWRLDVDDGLTGGSDGWRVFAVGGPLDRVAVGVREAAHGGDLVLFVCLLLLLTMVIGMDSVDVITIDVCDEEKSSVLNSAVVRVKSL
jgi:hypothetical protein